jgi:putative ABC transport system permease protein
MWNTRWLTLSSFLGLVIAVSFTTSIPMYADGALKRLVASTLRENSANMPAGSLLIRYQSTGNTKTAIDALEQAQRFIKEEIPQRIEFPSAAYVESLSLRGASVAVVDPARVDPSKQRQMTMISMSQFHDYAVLTNGIFPSSTLASGVLEAVVLEEGAFRNNIRVGDEFWYPLRGATERLRVKVVGTYTPKDDTNPYWFQGLEGLVNSFVIDESLMKRELLVRKALPLNLATWYYAFDLREIQTRQLASLDETLSRLDIELYQRLKDTKVDISFQPLLQQFRAQSMQLQLLLLMLAMPMLAMVFYFIAMNAKQSLDRHRTDIAVMRSRGAATGQLVGLVVLEGLTLGGMALVVGPMLGWFLAKSIGSASGFLTFVDRQSIPVGFGQDAILFGVAAVIIAMASSVIPAIASARSSIVDRRQQQARTDRVPMWQRWYLDVVLLGIVGYGWYLFQERRMISLQTGLTSDQLQVQPTLFFIPALAIFTLGLLFVRLFPLLLNVLNRLARYWFPVPLYLTLTQLTRSSSSYHPLMLLLILTLGLGVYNAAAARTIDQNSVERTLYKYGSDVVIQTVWEGFTASVEPPRQSNNNNNNPLQQVLYVEPPFQMFRELPGVAHAARVLQTRGNAVISGKSIGQGTVIGIDNVDFAHVAWWRNDLYPAHPYVYLDLLGQYEQSVIIPQTLADQYQLKPGDLASISMQGRLVEFIIVGILPYWPGQYPDEVPFYITNLDYIHDQIPIQPYEVWLKMQDGAKLTPIIQQLQEKGIRIASVEDVRNALITQNKHPARGGVFGILSLGFLISVLVSLAGYLLFWFFNLSNRAVQFGVLRTMGLSRRMLTGMLFMEQALTAGLSIVVGFSVGRLVSVLFLPFLQTTESAANQVPPFRIVFDQGDTAQLYIVIAVMFLLGGGLLVTHIRRLRVHQAVKLGEER